MIIKIQAVSKSYAHTFLRTELSVLRNVNLNVAPGEMVCLYGPNGVGKTTLLRIVAGLETPDSGTATFVGGNGGPVAIGMVFQKYRDSVFPWRTVLENVALPLESKMRYRLRKKEAKAKARQILEQFGLLELSGRYPPYLSGGQAQMVALCRALTVCDVLLLDEPFSALDPKNLERVLGFLTGFCKSRSIPAIVVTHDADLAIMASDRVAVMGFGTESVKGFVEVTLASRSLSEVFQAPAFYEYKRKMHEISLQD